jgi:prepilin-type N-terminal cleavage/methylation domain-containing protein
MKPRRGFTLIEIIVAIAVATVVLAAAVALLHALLRADAAHRDAMQRSAAVDRLTQQFRDDVHAAVRVAGASPDWQFDLPGGRSVAYQMTADGIVRIEKAGQAVAGRESFSLPAGAVARIETAMRGGATLVRLTVVPAAGDDAQSVSAAPYRIDAVMAADHRFARDASLQESGS